jgi:putative flavoprotein involved in K+ transport
MINADINFDKDRWKTIIIGAGQAGLAAGYYLKKKGEDFLVIDTAKRVGDSWRQRWDTLYLFTPSQYDGLPGFPFPAPRDTYPSKNEMADYLDKYATEFNLPVKLNDKVIRLSRGSSGFEITTLKSVLKADNVIIATGTNPFPKIPDFARDLDRSIFQIHSSQYTNPNSLPAGNVLVVGAGTSGMEIAIELAGSRNTMLAGVPTFHIPNPIFKYAGRLYWWFVSHILTVRTPIGRKARIGILKGGGPLIRVSEKDLIPARVEHVSRVVGVENGFPKLQDGRVVNVTSIVWATGFKPDFSWVDFDLTDKENGWPITKMGVSEHIAGLYFMGMLFQYGLTSGLVGGVGRDAAYIVKQIQKNKN